LTGGAATVGGGDGEAEDDSTLNQPSELVVEEEYFMAELVAHT
jgi:hypothetical protein